MKHPIFVYGESVVTLTVGRGQACMDYNVMEEVMGRFRREFQFSMKTKKHLFFLVLLWLVVASAVWIFQSSLDRQLKTAFPGDYSDSPKRTEKEFRITGTKDGMAQVEDIDLKAELLFNQALHQAEGMVYREVASEPVYIRDYKGPSAMAVGTGSTATANVNVEKDGATYGYVKAIWADEDTVRSAGLGMCAEELFRHPVDYINKLYVMLGYEYQANDVYQTGDTLQIRTEYGTVEAVVTGFLDKGAAISAGGKNICLDTYVLCPLVDMSNLYGEAPDTDTTYLSPIYVPEDFLMEGNRENGSSVTLEEITYSPVHAIWFDPDLRNDTGLDEKFQSFLKSESDYHMSFVCLGENFQKQGIKVGSTLTFVFGAGLRTATCTGFFPEGMTYKVDGREICLDDYIGIVQFDYEKMYPPKTQETPNTDVPVATPTPAPTESAPENNLAEMRPDVTYNLAERTKLYHVLFLKNTGYLRTGLTANETQRELGGIVEASWKNFYLEKEGNNPISSYRIFEAADFDSVLFREDAGSIVEKLDKLAGYLFLGGMLLVLLYFLLKRKGAQEYFVTIILTGTSVFEILMLFVFEMVILFAGSVGFGYLSSYVVCRLLQLTPVAWKVLIKSNLFVVLVPGILVLFLVAFTDYGKMFRRGRR